MKYHAARLVFSLAIICTSTVGADENAGNLNRHLRRILHQAGFTGRVQSMLEHRLGRPLNPQLANLGRLLWFDVVGGLHSDNTCGGCHSPTNGMGDTQSIAIGIQNNNLVGPHRSGPRNQRRTPTAANTAFYPSLMWNGRFSAPSGDPFNNAQGFLFPAPESNTKFLPNDPIVTHLLIAQAHIPPTELVEVAGFTGTANTIGPRFDVFDDGLGEIVPLPDSSGFRNEPIRQAVLGRLNASHQYRRLFGDLFPSVKTGDDIDFTMFGRAIAEFEFTLVFANAPIDQFARGDSGAMTLSLKRRERFCFSGRRDASPVMQSPGSPTKCLVTSKCTSQRSPRLLHSLAWMKVMSYLMAPGRMRTSAWNRSPAKRRIVTNFVRRP